MQVQYVTELPALSELGGMWVADFSVASTRYPADLDDRIPHTERPLVLQERECARTLGVNVGDDVVCYATNSLRVVGGHYASNKMKYLVASHEPFMVVRHTVGDASKYHSNYRWQKAARQVHFGALGRRPEIGGPKVLRSGIIEPGGRIDKPRKLNWVSVKTITDLTGLRPEQVFSGFAEFSAARYNRPNIPTLNRQPKYARNNDIVRIYPGDTPLPDGFCRGESAWGGDRNARLLSEYAPSDLAELFVPQSFAFAAMRLSLFGYQPDGTVPETAATLEAPMPPLPDHKFPILTDAEFEALIPVSMHMQEGDVMENDYLRAAEAALSSQKWTASPESNDTGLMQYNNQFQTLQRETSDGLVVISHGFWSRGGHGKGEYYVGLVTIFPRGTEVTDARRDDRALFRLVIHPGHAQRTEPLAPRGGLIPPGLPAASVELVEEFLLRLGYDI